MAKSLIYIDVSGIRRRLAEDLKERTPSEVEAWLIGRGLRLQWDGTWVGDERKLGSLSKHEYTVLERL
jgi:hypothetical protein